MVRLLAAALVVTLVPAFAYADDPPAAIQASISRIDFRAVGAPGRPGAMPRVMRPTRRQVGALIGAVGGLFAGGYAGSLVDRGLTGPCHGDMCGFTGVMIGMPV